MSLSSLSLTCHTSLSMRRNWLSSENATAGFNKCQDTEMVKHKCHYFYWGACAVDCDWQPSHPTSGQELKNHFTTGITNTNTSRVSPDTKTSHLVSERTLEENCQTLKRRSLQEKKAYPEAAYLQEARHWNNITLAATHISIQQNS